MTPQGVGLGSALMTWLIHELKERRLGEYTIEPGQLSEKQAETDEERQQRNAFYTGLGFTLISRSGQVDGDLAGGSFIAPNLDALVVAPRRLARIVSWRKFEAEQIRVFNPPKPFDEDLGRRKSAPLGPVRRLVVWLFGIPYPS